MPAISKVALLNRHLSQSHVIWVKKSHSKGFIIITDDALEQDEKQEGRLPKTGYIFHRMNTALAILRTEIDYTQANFQIAGPIFL